MSQPFMEMNDLAEREDDMDHQDAREETDRKLARDEERYRDEVSRGQHGAHPPNQKFPIEEAREEGKAGLQQRNPSGSDA